MADIVITPANVRAGTGARTINGVAGATITAGQSVVRDPTTRKYVPADADGAAGIRAMDSIALNNASDGQPIAVQTSGPITIGGAVVVGTIYVQSDTAGGIMPAADLEAGDYVTIVGVATSVAVIQLGLLASNVAVPA